MLSSRVLCSDYDRVFSFRLKIDAFSGNLLNYLADSHILTFFSLSLPLPLPLMPLFCLFVTFLFNDKLIFKIIELLE